MTGILLCCLLIILLTGCLYLVVARPDLVAAWVRRGLPDPDPWSWQARLRSRLLVVKRPVLEPWYPTDVAEAEANEAPDPVAEHFDRTSIYVESDHPRDCAKTCCWEIRLNELHDAFDWNAYEYEMRKTK